MLTSSKDLFIAIDQGGQSSRVALYDAHGQQLAIFSAACATRSYTDSTGAICVEQDGEEILAGIRDGLLQLTKFIGNDVTRIKAAGFAGQGSSLLCWNRQTGVALSPVLSWQDRRAEIFLNSLPLTQQIVREATGLRISPHYGASKMRWCLDHLPSVQQAAAANNLSIGPIASFLFVNLLRGSTTPNADVERECGSFVTSLEREKSHVTGTGISNTAVTKNKISNVIAANPNLNESQNPIADKYKDSNIENKKINDDELLYQETGIDPGHAQRTLLWNLTDNNWDKYLLQAFSLTPNVLPACRWHNSHFGNLFLGSHAIPLSSSQRDQGASLFARGMPESDAIYVNIGTGAFIQCITEQLKAPDGLLVSPLWFPEPETNAKKLYAWEATVNGAASALTWLANATAMKEIKPADIDHALTVAAPDTLYFLNAVGGLSAPWWRTDLSSRFSGDWSAPEKILAWIESVIFQIAINVALMKTDGVVQKIYISGGLSRAAGVCQRLADITGIKVLRSENADATLQGIAFTTAGMPEDWNSKSTDEIFTPTSNEGLQRRYNNWQKAMDIWLL
jgi:glycerol kinase